MTLRIHYRDNNTLMLGLEPAIATKALASN